ncbi:MAG TPA: SRPBCC family protein [Solirubrobacteraceae bacterium]|nr:SRPBCC family protein [Solirubrobacteraceae bacterium]
MPTAQRSRKLSAPPEQVWEVIADPHHMPRWWPDVKRMEGVEDDRWTQVFTTKKGRPVRMDFHLLESYPPGPGGDPPGRRVWEQDIVGTPFERVLGEAITEVLVERAPGPDGPAAGATRVTIALSQRLRGYSRTGGFLLARATRARLDEALRGLDEIVTPR